MRRIGVIAVLGLLVVLSPGAAALVGSGSQGNVPAITGLPTANASPQELVEQANRSLTDAEKAQEMRNYTEAFHKAREAEERTEEALQAGANVSSLRERAIRLKENVSREHARQEMGDAERRVEKINETLSAVQQLRGIAKGVGNVPQVRAAENAYSASQAEMRAARQALERGNATAALKHSRAALNRSRAAEQAFNRSRSQVKTSILSRIDARIDALEEEVEQARWEVRNAQGAPFARGNSREAREDLRQAEQELEEAREARDRVENSSSMEEMEVQSSRAAESLDSASSNVAGAQAAAESVRNAFYQALGGIAVLVAILMGGGFIYYRMSWKEMPWEEELEE